MNTKKKAKKAYAYKADEGVVAKARAKVYKESKGKQSLSSKIEEMLYDYISR